MGSGATHTHPNIFAKGFHSLKTACLQSSTWKAFVYVFLKKLLHFLVLAVIICSTFAFISIFKKSISYQTWSKTMQTVWEIMLLTSLGFGSGP